MGSIGCLDMESCSGVESTPSCIAQAVEVGPTSFVEVCCSLLYLDEMLYLCKGPRNVTLKTI